MKRMMTPTRQDALMAVAAFGVGVILLISGARAVKPGIPLELFLIPLAVTCVGVAIRRRRPVTAFVLGLAALAADATIGPSLGTAVVFTDNVYAACLYGPRKLLTVLLRISPVWVLATGVAAGVQAHDWGWGAVMAFQGGLIIVMPVTTAAIIRNHRDHARQATLMAELDRTAAIAAERTRMARSCTIWSRTISARSPSSRAPCCPEPIWTRGPSGRSWSRSGRTASRGWRRCAA